MQEKHSSTIENYLGMLYILERDKEPAVGTRMAELLGVSPPTITNTLKRMSRDGLVELNSNHTPHLTPAGLAAAHSLMRRHMLAEWMLSHLLSWSKIHDEAHLFEHAISGAVEEALLRQLESPQLCPHGNPLPGFEHMVANWIPLTATTTGERYFVRRIHELAEDTPQVLPFLEENRITPGQEILVTEILPFNQTITIEVESSKVSIGMGMARYIFLEPVVKPG
jgi:DtxR family Mn-dependent transcriptional regulator